MGISYCAQVSLLQLLHLERKLSVKFSTDTKRLLHLSRLARSFAYAWEHLDKFLESVLGPLSHASHVDITNDSCQYLREGKYIEQIKVFLERCSDSTITPVTHRLEYFRRCLSHCPALAQSRLRMIGVAFIGGALRRARRNPSCPMSSFSCLHRLKSTQTNHSSAVHKALFSSRWDARSGFGREEVSGFQMSCSADTHVQYAGESFRNCRVSNLSVLVHSKMHHKYRKLFSIPMQI